MEIDVLILYEHIPRELETCILLGRILEDLGLKVEIRSIPFQFWEAQDQLRPRLAVSPWRTKRILHLKAPGGGMPFVLDLHQEQIGNVSNQKMYYMSEEPFCSFFHAAWGQSFRDGLVEGGVDASKVFVTGYPRLDFYRPELLGLSLSRKKLASLYGLDPEKQWVVIVSSFSHADISSEDRRRFKKYGLTEEDEWANESILSRNSAFEMISTASAKNPGVEFIYRPHPSESSDVPERKGKGMRVIRELDIRHWFINSDAALIWNSTACVESFLARVPFYKFRPRPLGANWEIPMLEKVREANPENFQGILDELAAKGKEALWLELEGEYTHFRKCAEDIYDMSRFALVETAAIINSTLAGADEGEQPGSAQRYSPIRVFLDRKRTSIRDWGIRKKILTRLSRGYEIKQYDLPDRSREVEIENSVNENVDTGKIAELVRLKG